MKRFSTFRPAIFALLAALLSCQAGFIYHPDPDLVATPATLKLDYEEVRFTAADGTRLHGWWVPSREERAVAIHFHGNAGNISHRLKVIETLHNLKLSAFIFDYRGFGKSAGSPTERGTYADAEGAWNYLVRIKNVPPERIVLHGQSLGGGVASWLAVKHRPALLILESTFTSTRDVARHHCSFTPATWLITWRYDTLGRATKLACPLLVIHSPEDEVIPYSQGRAIFSAAREPKEFLEIRGSHNRGFVASYDVYVRGIDSFIKKYLPTGAAR